MIDNSFKQRYKITDTSELLDIIDNPNNYPRLAVETAQLEIDKRHLTPEQLADAKARQDLGRQEKVGRLQSFKNVQTRVKNFTSSLIMTFLIFGGLVRILCKESVRAVYRIDKKSMLTAFGIGIGSILLMTISFAL
jgi:hypothetical protein